MILPTKFENERIMFTIDYGDMLPWGSVVELAKITVEVSSGNDPYPQRVFSQIWDIEGTIVTYQVRRGVPGVIYRLLTAVLVAGNWIYKEVRLAIAPDHGDVGSLYPLTRILTTHPYIQYYDTPLVSFLSAAGGELRTILHFGDISPDKMGAQLASMGGEIKDPPNGIFKDSAASTLIARGGELKLPRAHRMSPDAIENALIANGGELLIPPSGTMESDSVDGALVATGGELLSGWAVSALYELPYENPGWSGYNFRLRIPAADMPAGTKVRLTLRGASSEGFKVTTAHFGRAATSGDLYDFASAPTQVKFGGANSVTIAATAAVVTDEITMTITGTNDYLLAVYCNDGNNDVMPYGGSFGGQAYYRGAGNQSSTTNVSGYTNWGGVAALVEKIEIYP